MIPRAVEQVFRVASEMKSRGWEYKIEGQFLEIVSLITRSDFTQYSSLPVQRNHQRSLREG